jgi:hypothetical protein
MAMAQQTKLKLKTLNLKLLYKAVFVVLIGIILFNVFSVVLQQKEKYFTFNYQANYSSLQRTYYASIYKDKHGTWIPDEIIYSYVGGALVKGKSPILLNPEVPPLGTYIIGLSTVIFNNQYIVIVFFALLSLYLMYLIGKQIYPSKLIALIPPVLFSFEPMFKNQLIYTPLLDIIQLTFLLAVFYFLNKALQTKSRFLLYAVLLNVFLGFFISTKFFGTGITVVVAILATFFIHREWKKLAITLLTMPISIIILYATYFRVLLDGYPLNRFFGIQKWIFLYNSGHLRNPLSIWPLLFLNKWYVSSGKNIVSFDPQWLILWPIITSISLLTALASVLKRLCRREVEPMLIWIIAYLLLMSLVDANARYFVILMPILYMIALYGIMELVQSKKFIKLIRFRI